MRNRRRVAVVLTAGILTLAVASTAMAVDQVAQTVNPGTRSASIADLALPAVNYSHADQTSSGTMALSVDDSSATGAGWNVTIQTSDFAYSGTNGGSAIPAANLALTAAATPVHVAGQAIDATGGPKVPAASPVGTLDSARKVIQADTDFGQGSYSQDLSVELTVPGQSRAGSYTGTITTTINAGP